MKFIEFLCRGKKIGNENAQKKDMEITDDME